MAMDALGRVNGPRSVAAIAEAVNQRSVFVMERAAMTAWSQMGPERSEDLKTVLDHPNPFVRATLLESLTRRKPDPAFLPLLRKGLEDPVERVRAWAATALANDVSEDRAQLLLKALDDRSGWVQNRAATSLKGMVCSGRVSEELKRQILGKLVARFKEFGPKSARSDREWGWRPIGDAILEGFGHQGPAELAKILNGTDTPLAQLAWQVLFLRDDGWGWHPKTAEEANRDYRYYPGLPSREVYQPARSKPGP
jgi:hypothetical protein